MELWNERPLLYYSRQQLCAQWLAVWLSVVCPHWYVKVLLYSVSNSISVRSDWMLFQIPGNIICIENLEKHIFINNTRESNPGSCTQLRHWTTRLQIQSICIRNIFWNKKNFNAKIFKPKSHTTRAKSHTQLCKSPITKNWD